MPFIQAGDVFKKKSLGNVIGILDAWVGDGIVDFDGSERKLTYGLARLTDTLQTAIPLIIPSWRGNQTVWPDRPLVLPAGVTINYVGLRLPEYGNQFEGASPWGLLPNNCQIVGTTGENLKVSPATGATTHTTTSPSVVCGPNNQYTPDAFSTSFRTSGQANQPAPSWLTTLPAATTPQITISNAANTAAGNGVRLSQTGAIAFIIVWFALEFDLAPPRMREVELPFMPIA
jgi:hypothetical protein